MHVYAQYIQIKTITQIPDAPATTALHIGITFNRIQC